MKTMFIVVEQELYEGGHVTAFETLDEALEFAANSTLVDVYVYEVVREIDEQTGETKPIKPGRQ